MPDIDAADVKKLVIACDAGMGSSVMLASTVKKQLKGTSVTVEHTPVDQIPPDADIVMCHSGLAERARRKQPNAIVIPFNLFMGDPAVTRVVNAIKNGGTISG